MNFLVICIIIFLGSLLSGAVPFFLALSEKHMSLLSAFGAGLLISTALAVILPEGIEAFHKAQEESGMPTTFKACMPFKLITLFSINFPSTHSICRQDSYISVLVAPSDESFSSIRAWQCISAKVEPQERHSSS